MQHKPPLLPALPRATMLTGHCTASPSRMVARDENLQRVRAHLLQPARSCRQSREALGRFENPLPFTHECVSGEACARRGEESNG